MATTEFIAAIELGSSKISGIAGRKNYDGSMQVLAFASEEASSFVHKGIIYNIDKAAQALTSIIGKLEAQLKCSIAKVYVGIGGQSLRTVKNSITRFMEEECIFSNELVDELYAENRETLISDINLLDVEPQEYKIGNSLHTDPVGVTGHQITGQYLNIVARTTLKKNLELSLKQAQIEIADDLIVAPISLAKSVLTENEMRSGCALIDLGADTTTVLVYKNNLLRYLCVLPLGGNNITYDLTSLQIEEEEAEKLKLQHGDALYEEENNDTTATCQTEDGRNIELSTLNNIIGARAEEILRNAWNQICLSNYENTLYAGVVLTGGTANLKNTEELFRKVSRIEKVKTVKATLNDIVGFSDVLKDGRYNSLVGLLIGKKENCCRPEPQNSGNSRTLFGDEEIPDTPKPPIPPKPNPTPKPDPKPTPDSSKSNKSSSFIGKFKEKIEKMQRGLWDDEKMSEDNL
ncbi:MAG: cell division protein FtsA [Bacteroides sp.]|nr:cell division protein FtsA [Bacteroides sp.]